MRDILKDRYMDVSNMFESLNESFATDGYEFSEILSVIGCIEIRFLELKNNFIKNIYLQDSQPTEIHLEDLIHENCSNN